MTKPADTIHWCDTPSTLRTDPPAGLQNTGFSAIMKLPAQYINAHLGRIWDWLIWLNTRIFDAYTLPSAGADCRVYGDPDEGVAIKNESGTYLPARCGDPGYGALQEIINLGYLDTALAGMMARCSVTCGVLAITKALDTALTFNADGGPYDVNVGGIWASGDPTNFWAQQNGTHHISASVAIGSASAANIRLAIKVTRSAVTTQVAADCKDCGAGETIIMSVATDVELQTGDQVQFFMLVTGSDDGAIASGRATVREVTGATPPWA